MTFFSLFLLVFFSLIVLTILGLLFWRSRLAFKLKLRRALDLVMLQVLIPKEQPRKENEPPKDFKEIIGVADQMFSALSSIYERSPSSLFLGQPHLSFEIVAKDKEIIFYVGTPRRLQNTVEKTILSFYPSASVEESDEFRIFRREDKVAAASLVLKKRFLFPIRTYTKLEFDSLNGITNALSKLGEDSRATIQILIRPVSDRWRNNVASAARLVQEGRNIPVSDSILGRAFSSFFYGLFDLFSRSPRRQPYQNQYEQTRPHAAMYQMTQSQEELIKALGEKSAKIGFQTQIRVVTTAPTVEQAKVHLQSVTSAFAQFNTPSLNSFRSGRMKNQVQFLSNFVLRHFTGRSSQILNTEELASLFHLPNQYVETPGIRFLLSRRAPAPANLPKEGIILGENVYRGSRELVRLKEDDRRRHVYVIGMTGTGKTTLFESLILQDIRERRGVAFLDPHGDISRRILNKIPKERAEDVIYFDPADMERPFGLNLLEWKTPEQKDFLVQEAIQIFYKLFDPTHQGIVGPQFEHWLRNAALTLMEAPEGGTIIEIPRLFTDDAYREKKIQNVKDTVVKAFWTQQLQKTAEFHKSEMYNYFISKFGRFMTNEMMRNIMGQAKSSFDFRQVMDEGKILLVNLSKGRVGEVNANLLGMILVAKLYAAAMSRAEVSEEQRKDFHLYVDEFQNFTTDTFASILSEARKYRLNLNITNQYIAQLPELIRDAIIGNVGTIISFRIGVPDAEFMAKEFEPVFIQTDLINIDKFHCDIKLLIDNAPTRAFSMLTLKDPTFENEQLGRAIWQLSRLKYGRSRSLVDEEIENRTRLEEVGLPGAAVAPPAREAR